MQFSEKYLAGYTFAEPDDKAHIVRLAPKNLQGHIADHANDMILAMQEKGYEIVNVSISPGGNASGPEACVVYR